MIRTYSIPETSEMTGIPKQTLYAGIRDGTLRAGIRRGNKRGWRVTEQAVREFWKELENGSGKEKAHPAESTE